MEMKYRKPISGKNSLDTQLEQHANSSTLDFSDDPDEFTPDGIWAQRPTMGEFAPLCDEDDEERISLVKMEKPIQQPEQLELKSDSESDEE